MSFSFKDKLAGKTVWIKIDYLDNAGPAKIAETDENGVWIEGGDIFAAFHQRFRAKGPQGTYSALPAPNPVVFVPYQHIQWLAVQKQ